MLDKKCYVEGPVFNEPISIRSFVDELWELFFVVAKGVVQTFAATIYFLALFLLFLVQWLYLGARWLYRLAKTWRPVRPSVFNLENEQ